MIFLKGKAVRGDTVPEVMALSHGILQIEMEKLLLARAIKVMQKPQAVMDCDLPDAGRHAGQTGGQVGADTGEERMGFLNAFLLHGDRDVLLLNEIIALRRLAQHKPVILTSVEVAAVSLHRHEERSPKVLLVELTVEQRDLRCGPNGERVQEGAVDHKEFPLLFRGCHGVIDIKKAPSL